VLFEEASVLVLASEVVIIARDDECRCVELVGFALATTCIQQW
jgi:hypothetical protein